MRGYGFENAVYLLLAKHGSSAGTKRGRVFINLFYLDLSL
jgi:hypothetical protein